AFAPHDAPRYAIAVVVQHGGGSRVGAEKAREVMRVTLLKDPDMRTRIERPPPPEPVGPVEEEDPAAIAPPAPAPAAPPAASRPQPAPAPAGPQPYLPQGGAQ
ncbi:MAG: penicillin-binding protein 2, partial [Brevundimonas sp.]